MKNTIRTCTVRPRAGFGVATGSLAAAAALLAVPAHAEAPDNDDIAGAERTTTAQSTIVFDTTEATAARSDGQCVGGHSIWYTFRAPATQRFRPVSYTHLTLPTNREV